MCDTPCFERAALALGFTASPGVNPAEAATMREAEDVPNPSAILLLAQFELHTNSTDVGGYGRD